MTQQPTQAPLVAEELTRLAEYALDERNNNASGLAASLLRAVSIARDLARQLEQADIAEQNANEEIRLWRDSSYTAKQQAEQAEREKERR